ncbi:ribonuclease P protein component [Patescibacteria group bacterium]|nr:ribonuclease P protein component [Patescibacteria group bacterium]MBU4600930.1 ribonuclease P protein component [Patescibacteria group bacterium]MCG2698551.1 ribonuclease P protein component [Candidatus Parcubacteria bacterium]
MFAKINRLTKDKDFDNVFKNGKSSYDKIIGVKAAANQQKNSRFGILVSAKVSKKAVERNVIKRRIREALKPQSVKIAESRDVIIIAFPAILGKSYQDVEQSIIRHFKRLGLLKLEISSRGGSSSG